MQDIIKLEAGHEDLIHDIAYDYYGKKLVVREYERMMMYIDLFL
jgi:hypothetical protein